jgi:hypothetical protein
MEREWHETYEKFHNGDEGALVRLRNTLNTDPAIPKNRDFRWTHIQASIYEH